MAVLYGLMWAYQFVLPVAVLFVLWLVLAWVLRRIGPVLSRVVSAALVAALAAVPISWERVQLAQDFAAIAVDEVNGPVDVPPGRLLIFSDGARSCWIICPLFTSLGIFTEAEFLTLGGWLGNGSDPLAPIDLNIATEGRAAAFDYVAIEMPAYLLPVVAGYDDYRLPHWPRAVNTVLVVVAAPDDGILDLRVSDVLYQRFILQLQLTPYPFWPTGDENVRVPALADIVAEMDGQSVTGR